MSKGRVWNKGKRNGGGGPPPGKVGHKEREKLEHAKNGTTPEVASSPNNTIAAPFNQVKRMTRANWVERPKRDSAAQVKPAINLQDIPGETAESPKKPQV